MSINFKGIKINNGTRVLVNFHAYNSCKEDNQALIDFCAKNHISYYAVDFPGQGDSEIINVVDKPTMTHFAKLASIFVNQINSDDIILVGHCMGGAIAVIVASYCYDKVERIILENPISPMLFKDESMRAHVLDKLLSQDKMCRLVNDNVELVDINEQRQEFIKSLAADLSSETFLKQMKRELSKINDKRIDVIIGANDTIVPGEESKKYFEHIDRGLIKVHYVEDAGHHMHKDKPDEYTKILEDILIK